MKPRSWIQGMKSGFAAASIGPSTHQSSALPTPGEARQRAVDAAVQKALESAIPAALSEQRERIAAGICRCADQYAQGGAIQAVLYATARDIRSGEIGGEQK